MVGGFDLDNDGVKELLLLTRAGRERSRFIDLVAGEIQDVSFAKQPDDVWAPFARRLQDSVSPNALLLVAVGGLWLVVGLGVYCVVLLKQLLVRLMAFGAKRSD